MPLRKLWNSIRGSQKTSDNSRFETATSVESDLSDQSLSSTSQVDTSVPIDLGHHGSKSAEKGQTRKSTKMSREDKRLCSRLASQEFSTILEISVDNSARSVSILETITQGKSDTDLRYLAIDQFELGGSALTLRGFHKQLREVRVKAQLLPMTVEAGLERVLRTIGQVDVILWSSEDSPSDQAARLLGRISRPDTLLFSIAGKHWEESRSGLMNGNGQQAA